MLTFFIDFIKSFSKDVFGSLSSLLLIGVQGARLSARTSGTGETLFGAKRQVAHRPPRGKRASWNGNQPLLRALKITKTAFKKMVKKKTTFSMVFFLLF
ncbi:hypothetical protein AWM68_11300 [Fictibacillus phosphorivorans]|uniref:Uncharacterized protein n=1 Tax=Fictibacillus phosphorivorans TaxID=1221500 RepID=A0A163PLD1_9BACL|nr:hypothetical protein AWM68_11300 [Fictibacillus phosphorivorans]